VSLQVGHEFLGDVGVAARKTAFRKILLDCATGALAKRAVLAAAVTAVPTQFPLGGANKLRRVRLRLRQGLRTDGGIFERRDGRCSRFRLRRRRVLTRCVNNAFQRIGCKVGLFLLLT
jgi:hypothetical protein